MEIFDCTGGRLPPELPVQILPVVIAIKNMHTLVTDLAERFCSIVCMVKLSAERHKIPDVADQVIGDTLLICKDGLTAICMVPREERVTEEYRKRRVQACRLIGSRLVGLSKYGAAWPEKTYGRLYAEDAFEALIGDAFEELDKAWIIMLQAILNHMGLMGNKMQFLESVAPLGGQLLDQHVGHAFEGEERARTMSMLRQYEQLVANGASEHDALTTCNASMAAARAPRAPEEVMNDGALDEWLKNLTEKKEG